MTDPADGARQMLRHTLATLAYRAAKPLRGAPPTFATFRAAPTSRSPGEILAHLCDLFDWALHLAKGAHVFHETKPADWDSDIARFFAALSAFDAQLSSDAPLGWSAERIFQGPIADALQHVGQLTMLRRLAGSPILGENYARATIEVGRVGASQAEAVMEFE